MNPFINPQAPPNPITREEWEAFLRREAEPTKLPRQIKLLVHPRDLVALKRFFQTGK